MGNFIDIWKEVFVNVIKDFNFKFYIEYFKL